MALFTFWSTDPLPDRNDIRKVEIQKVFDIGLLSNLTTLSHEALEKRFENGNEAWVLTFQGLPVSFGWIGRGMINIGEIAKELILSSSDAYFWNFRTLEAYRGNGFYPHLLQAMIRSEIKISNRLWIIAAPENRSSFKGIVKSGFSPVGLLAYDSEQSVALSPFKTSERAEVASKIFQVPLVNSAVKPCWSCYSNTMKITRQGCECKQHGHACSCGSKKINNTNSKPQAQ